MSVLTEAALGTLAGTKTGLALVCNGSDMGPSWAHGGCMASRGEIFLRSCNAIAFVRPVTLESPLKLTLAVASAFALTVIRTI